MRALDLYGLARQAVDVQTDATRAALEAYADGVNAWLRVVQEKALGRGAPEFFLFSPDIAPWTPADSIAIQKLMALQLTDKASMETLRARAVAGAAARAAARHPARFAERADHGPAGVLRSSFRRADAGRWSRRRATRSTRCRARGSRGRRTPSPRSGRRTAGGAPLLATDPHLRL